VLACRPTDTRPYATMAGPYASISSVRWFRRAANVQRAATVAPYCCICRWARSPPAAGTGLASTKVCSAHGAAVSAVAGCCGTHRDDDHLRAHQ
jgi:hypothetical protein